MGALAGDAAAYAAKSKASSTLRAYASDWRDFSHWCQVQGLEALPARSATVAYYLAALAKRERKSVATIQRRMSAISQAHQLQGHPSPTVQAHVRAVMAGIRRENGVAPVQKAAAVIEQLREMVGPALMVPAPTVPLARMSVDAAAEDGARAENGSSGAASNAHSSHPDRANQAALLRDRALLLVGFAAALRRSELVALDVRDVVFTPHAGMVLTVRKSKTDQEGEGHQRGVPFGQNPATCPVRALQAWLAAGGITEGPLFRAVDRFGRVANEALSAYAVALIVKRAAARAGLDPTQYAGHSLRSGLATSAAAAGVEERTIMEQGGWTSLVIVRRYIRTGGLFRKNAAGGVGL